MGGGGYVLEKTADRMVETDGFQRVTDAPVLNQPVYGAMHLRHRTARTHRQLARIVGENLSQRG
jgi:hypothetical protein